MNRPDQLSIIALLYKQITRITVQNYEIKNSSFVSHNDSQVECLIIYHIGYFLILFFLLW